MYLIYLRLYCVFQRKQTLKFTTDLTSDCVFDCRQFVWIKIYQSQPNPFELIEVYLCFQRGPEKVLGRKIVRETVSRYHFYNTRFLSIRTKNALHETVLLLKNNRI